MNIKGIRAAMKLLDPEGDSVFSALEVAFRQMDQAEDEIRRAQLLRPGDADVLWHSFRLLVPTHDRMGTEFVYRSHCRELLRRAGRSEDTRPGTSAEIICLLSDTSQLAPFTTAAAGLCIRIWKQAFPAERQVFDEAGLIGEHYEALKGSSISDLEAEARRKLARKDRVIKRECEGLHHGKPVPGCRFRVTAEVAA